MWIYSINTQQWRSQESRQEGLLPLLPPLAPPLLLLPSQICRRGLGGLHGDYSGRGGLSPSRPTAASAPGSAAAMEGGGRSQVALQERHPLGLARDARSHWRRCRPGRGVVEGCGGVDEAELGGNGLHEEGRRIGGGAPGRCSALSSSAAPASRVRPPQ